MKLWPKAVRMDRALPMLTNDCKRRRRQARMHRQFIIGGKQKIKFLPVIWVNFLKKAAQ